jgi:hypothetical protein
MLLKPVVAVAAVLVCAQAALAQPVITQRHAYEGKQRPTTQLATVFGKVLTCRSRIRWR